MRWRWLATLAIVLCLQVFIVPARSVRAWEGRLGDWSPARPALQAGRIEHAVFRLEVPFRTQKDGGRWQISNCGPATLGMILDGFGITGQATDELRLRSHTYQGTVGMRTGTALQHIARVAEDLGVPTSGLYEEGDRFRAWSLDDIRGELRQSRPVMPLVRLYLMPGHEGIGPRWGHYVLLTGITEDGFFYSDSLQTDPATGATRTIPAAQLERAMRASHIPGQAVAFGGPGLASLKVWTPDR
jgi:peptidase C39-like protein